MYREVLRIVTLGAAVALAATGPSSAEAQKRKDKAAASAKEKPSADVAALEARLKSAKPAEVAAALAEVAELDEPPAALAPAVEGLLATGGSAEFIDAVIKAAAAIKSETSSAALALYARHRNAEVRRAAVKALLKTKGPAAVAALRAALSSGDAVVRGTAASGLGGLEAKDALPDLFRAFDHRVGEAAASIGQLCDPKQCSEFTSRLGKFPFDVMSGGFEQILFRPAAVMSDDEKMKLVGRLRELGTPEVGAFLGDVAGRWPAGWSARVKQALEQAAKQTGAGGGE